MRDAVIVAANLVIVLGSFHLVHKLAYWSGRNKGMLDVVQTLLSRAKLEQDLGNPTGVKSITDSMDDILAQLDTRLGGNPLEIIKKALREK